MLPDELQHQQFVKVRIEQGTHNGIEFPVVVMGTAGDIDDHEEYFTVRGGASIELSMRACTRSSSSGMAPDCDATQPPQRLPASFRVARSAPRNMYSVMTAVNASPAPMVSATLTAMPGWSCHVSRVTRRLPLPPRVTATMVRVGNSASSFSAADRRAPGASRSN